MRRTQIYLDEETYHYLKKESQFSGKTISDIIRSRVKDRIKTNKETILRNIEEVFGIWKDRKMVVDAYIRDMRKDRTL
jgi:negative regulator of replication initiation